MRVLDDLRAWRSVRADLAGSVGFVPTMGALHAGHAALLRRSVEENDITVLSIYLNPTQFNDPKDLAKYPASLDADLAVAEELGVDYVLLPTGDDMYADGFRYQVTEQAFSLELCGADRPGHFTGVLTVVLKLLNLVRPVRAYFGKKDFQQYRLVQDMCEAFFIDTEIVGCETVRESDGLAMSSRNRLLDSDSRARAATLNRVLRDAPDDATAVALLEREGFAVDYVVSKYGRRFAAVVVTCDGQTVRLIDNLAVAEDVSQRDVGEVRHSAQRSAQRSGYARRRGTVGRVETDHATHMETESLGA